MPRKKTTPRTEPEADKTPEPLPALGNTYDRAVRLLQDLCNDRMILMQNSECGLYLVPSILGVGSSDVHPPGTVEYQLSDGPPNRRTKSLDFTSITEAVARFHHMENGEGWSETNADGDHAALKTPRPRRFLVTYVSGGDLRRKMVYNDVDSALGGMFPNASNAAMLLMPRVRDWAREARSGDTLVVSHYGQITVQGDDKQTTVLEVVETVRVLDDLFKV